MSTELHSRWFHRPIVHVSPTSGQRKLSWLEMFYTLVSVVIWWRTVFLIDIMQGSLEILLFCATFIPLWTAWVSFSFAQNRYLVDDLLHRAMISCEILALCSAAFFLPDVYGGSWFGFALSYAALRAFQGVGSLRVWLQSPATSAMSKRRALGLLVVSVSWAVLAFLPAPWWGFVWVVALLVEAAIPVGKAFRELHAQHHADLIHRSDQYALAVLLLLGVLSVENLRAVLDLGTVTNHIYTCVAGCGTLAGLWWMYFDDIAGSQLKSLRLASTLWVYSHLPFMACIALFGSALYASLSIPPDSSLSIPHRWFLCGSLVGVFLSVAAIDAVTARRQADLSDRARVVLRLISALLVFSIAVVSMILPTWGWMLALAVVCVAQVLLDLIFVPQTEDASVYLQGVREHYVSMRRGSKRGLTIQDTETEDRAKTTPQVSARDRGVRRMRAVQRRGAPSQLRRDLYFHFMRASWGHVFGGIILLFMLVNVFFASLYLVEPWSVSGVSPESFWDAFFFSVQTLSTIGYGSMVPATPYGHAVVTLEAGVGMVLVALVTGFVYAKATRPGASVLFSDVGVMTRFEGKPTLMIRVGNARGNEIIEASVSAVALCRRETREGHEMRRLLDMKLVRNTSPIFSMSWTIMHVIDEDSPLYGVTSENMREHLDFVLFTLTGHDDTYAQMIHTRQYYEPEHIQWDKEFVDVMTRTSDGRIQIDYTAFHDTRDSAALYTPEDGDDPPEGSEGGFEEEV